MTEQPKKDDARRVLITQVSDHPSSWVSKGDQQKMCKDPNVNR